MLQHFFSLLYSCYPCCLGSVKVVLAAVAAQVETDSGANKAGLNGVKSAVGLIQERFADQAGVPVQLVKLLLAQEKIWWYPVIFVTVHWHSLVRPAGCMCNYLLLPQVLN